MTHAIVVRGLGAPDVLHLEVVDPGAPARGEVRLRHEAIGVNFVDLLVRDGRFGFRPPFVPGFEGAGVVTAIGPGVQGIAIGDRVGYFFSAGAYAEERTIEASSLIGLPDDITTVQAAMFLSTGLTAWMGLNALHDLRPGQIVAVVGASGGVGAVLTRWARHLGATVIGIAGSARRLADVARVATVAVAADDPDVLRVVQGTAPSGVDVVYDLVGGAVFDITTRIVRDGGTIVAIGQASGAPISQTGELARRRVSIRQGGTPQYVNDGTVGPATAELFDVIRQGVLSDLEPQFFTLAEASLAHAAMEARSLHGVPVLRP